MTPEEVEAAYQAIAVGEPLFAPHASEAFEVLSTLGEGGMGSVFEVRDRRTGRRAALKLLQTSNAGAQERFLREALLTARLDHPSIPPVFEVGRSARGELYLLMRSVPGLTLEAAVLQERRGALSQRRPLLQAVVKVAEALAYAHSQGILHRDIKPSNIMVGAFGEVLLMDWGVAKDLHDSRPEPTLTGTISAKQAAEVGLTLAGDAVGTPGYMAPEQARGEEVDARADVYALGLLLGEVISGEPLIDGESSLIRHVANTEGRTRLAELRRRIPKPLAGILAQALSEDPEDRTESAEAFAHQLQAWLADDEVPGYRYGLWERGMRRLRRNPAGALGLVSAVALTWGLVEAWRELGRGEAELKRARLVEAQARESAERAERVLALFNAARDDARRGRLPSLRANLTAALEASGRSQQALLTAAEVSSFGGDEAGARALLEEGVERFPPAYDQLFQLHQLDAGRDLSKATPALQELTRRARERGDENAYTCFFEGARLEAEGRLEEALAAYDRAEAYNRRFKALYHQRGLLRGEMGDLQAALEDLRRALELDPGYAMASYNLGVVLTRLEDQDGALAAYDRAISLDAELAEAHTNRGVLMLAAGELESARRDFERALALDPKDAVALTGRGEVRERSGDRRGALSDFDSALAIQPGYARALHHRGDVYQTLGDLDRALEDYERAIALSPDWALPHYDRATILQSRQQWEAARAGYSKALTLDPSFSAAYNNRALVYRELGQPLAALADLDEMIRRAPKHSGARVNRGLLLKELGRLDEAAAALDSALELDPKSARAYNARGEIEASRGQPERALAAYDSAVELAPEALSFRFNRGRLRASRGDLREALRDFDVILSKDPRDVESYTLRGELRLALGDPLGASSDAEAALALQPRWVRARVLRARLCEARGDIAGARRDLEAALASQPPPSVIAELEARLAELGD